MLYLFLAQTQVLQGNSIQAHAIFVFVLDLFYPTILVFMLVLDLFLAQIQAL